MKKNLLALSVAAAVLAAAGTATAAVSNTAYLGFQAGYAHADWDNVADTDKFERGNNDAFATGIYGGYNFTSFLALEGAYKYFNGIDAKYQDNPESKDITVHGPELAVRLAFPLNDTGADIFVRGGGMYAFSSGNGDKFVPVAGLGVSFDVSPDFDVRLGYDRYFDVYDSDNETTGIEFDMDVAYLGLNYVWGRSAPAPVVQETVTNTVTNTYTLDANTTFAFDSFKLSENGKDAIGQVVNAANETKLEGAQYVVVGHTDRLGRAAYNQKLSEQRASAVADELVALGVPSGDIQVSGVGSTEPVTGAECDGKTRNELIKCYAPDRRVVINVTGSQTTTETVTK